MIEYLGNCNNVVDWDTFIAELEIIPPMVGYQREDDRANSNDPSVAEVVTSWKTAGYDLSHSITSPVAWEAWYSGEHFDNQIVDKLSNLLNITPIDVSMVTRLIPGRLAPWHWDIRDQDTIDRFNSYKKTIIRVHIHMNKPNPGHIFVIEDQCFYNEKQGDMYKWPDWRSYHCGANCGMVPKYQFSIIGISRD
jgi:hypothetical protein